MSVLALFQNPDGAFRLSVVLLRVTGSPFTTLDCVPSFGISVLDFPM